MPFPIVLSPRVLKRQLVEQWARVREARQSFTEAQRILGDLKAHDPRDLGPVQVLELSDSSFREALARFLALPAATPIDLIADFRGKGRKLHTKVFRGQPPSYKKLVRAIARKLKVPKSKTVWSMESAITVHCFNKAWQQMSPEQQQQFRERLQKDIATPGVYGPGFSAEMLTVGGLALAQASGFGVYLAASTLLGALTHAIGVTLPFAVYTAMSSTIAFVIGPAGWALLGVAVLAKLFGPNLQDLVRGIITICGARSQLLAEWERSLAEAQRRADSAQSAFREHLASRRRLFVQFAMACAIWAAVPLLSIAGAILAFNR